MISINLDLLVQTVDDRVQLLFLLLLVSRVFLIQQLVIVGGAQLFANYEEILKAYDEVLMVGDVEVVVEDALAAHHHVEIAVLMGTNFFNCSVWVFLAGQLNLLARLSLLSVEERFLVRLGTLEVDGHW